jgi:hypothetical protein
LHRPTRQLADGGAERVVIQKPERRGLHVGGFEVVDVDREVVRTWRGRLALEEMQLLRAESAIR